MRPLPSKFYARHTLRVARDLLGKIVWVDSPQGLVGGRIVETEAYRGDDPASHSCRGETPRAKIMFGEPGVAYVYFIYGMYEMLNFVTEKKGSAGAVLIRALEPIHGIELMRARRPGRRDHDLANGPGRLTLALGITRRAHNGASLQGPRKDSQIWVSEGARPKRQEIRVSPRVGIKVGCDELWRFFIAGNPRVSRAPQNALGVPL